MKRASLRTRLITIILTPLLLIAFAAGYWQLRSATERAGEIFDRGLLSTALAISRDVALSDGDALSRATRDLIRDTSGGPVFYHVYAPDGVFVTGYATPPVAPRPSAESAEPLFYDASYQSQPVRVLRFQDATEVGGLSGLFTITVWQNTAIRAAFVRDLATQSFLVIAILVASVAIVVWFGVRLGLRPLVELEEAISRRSSTDLQPIRRAVPVEAQGVVETLNTLLAQVSDTMTSKTNFISNAAHQLRNPIAGVQALAEAVQSAETAQDVAERTADLVAATRETSQLANQLLSYERASALNIAEKAESFDLAEAAETALQNVQPLFAAAGITPTLRTGTHPALVSGNKLMLQEALQNLLHNALVHGGPALTSIALQISAQDGTAEAKVADDGVGIRPADIPRVLERFGQAATGPGSGLGLPIAETVARQHGGSLTIETPSKGTTITLRIPLHHPAPARAKAAIHTQKAPA